MKTKSFLLLALVALTLGSLVTACGSKVKSDPETEKKLVGTWFLPIDEEDDGETISCLLTFDSDNTMSIQWEVSYMSETLVDVKVKGKWAASAKELEINLDMETAKYEFAEIYSESEKREVKNEFEKELATSIGISEIVKITDDELTLREDDEEEILYRVK